jgi:DNA-binding Lrp family transcriptional regulator
MTDNLDFLDADSRKLVLSFLRGVADRPDLHVNRFRIDGDKRGGFIYFLGQTGQASAIPNRVPLGHQFVTALMGHGWAIQEGDGWYRFTDDALAWYRDHKYTDADIQRMLGLYLLESLEEVGHVMAPHQEHDMDALAERIGVSVDRLKRNVKRLEAMGYIEGPGVYERAIEEGNFGLTSPLGVSWANGGAQPIVHQQSQNFSFDFQFRFQFNVSIQELENAIESLDVDPEIADPIKESIEEFEEDPSPDTLRSLISLASDVTTIGTPIFPTVMTWLSHYHDLINSLFQMRPPI